MKKVVSKIIGSLLGITLSVGIGVAISSNSKEAIPALAIGNYSTDASTYYKDITATSGTQLAAQLHDLITSTHKYYTSYADNGANGYQKNSDRYYENGVAQSGYIYEFYSGVKWPDAWAATAGNTTGGYNREHCWCQSNSVNTDGKQMWGENGGGADMHHLRPVEVRLNSTRSNYEYGEISNRDSNKVYAKFGTDTTYAHGGYLSGGTFEPLDSKKGDVARIILYTYLHYNSYTISTLFGSYGTTNGSGNSSYFSTSLLSLTKTTNQSTEAKALEMLLSWNASDPVDEIEQRRNEQVAIYQGNRNPFIDNSNYAEMIWGDGSSSTTPTVNSVSVSPSTLNLDLNGTTTGNLTATVNVSNGAATTVTWTSSNTNVATVSSSGVVTAVAKGSCTITATSTVNSNKSASCSVKVTDSSGGGGGSQTITGNFTWNLVMASYNGGPTANLVTWSHEYATMESIRTDSSKTAANNYLGGDSNNRTSSRFYSGNTLTITPASDYTITSVVFTATSINYASALGNSTWTNASASVSSSTVTVTPTDGETAISAVIGGTCGFTSVQVNYSTTTSGSSSTLSSISLNTSNVQTEFYVGDTFAYSGLVVTAHYEDGTEDTVTPSSVSSPNMSTSGNKTITVTYIENNVTKTATYIITILNAEVTSISASVNKTYTVEDNLGNEITTFTFSNDGYQFTYDDAPSGGNEATKTFTNSVSYSSFSCDLIVYVSRVDYVTPVSYNDTMNRSWTGVSSDSYTAWTNKTGTSGATYAGKSAGPSTGDYANTIQLRSSGSDCGIVTTAYSGSLYLSNISVTWKTGTASGRTINVYGKTTAYSSAADLYNNSNQGTLLGTIVMGTSTSLAITGNYQYIGFRSASSALYLEEVVVTYGNSETATNVSNFIMINDTENQCLTKLGQTITKLNNMSSSEKSIFYSSDDYVVSTARNRLEAWARHEGKTITYKDGDYIVSSRAISPFNDIIKNDSSITIVIIISLIGITAIGGYFFLKHKKEVE